MARRGGPKRAADALPSRPVNGSALDKLSTHLGATWQNIAEARRRTDHTLQKLGVLTDLASEDAAIIVYGSIGRSEVTEDSDVDWTLLIDGPSDPQHSQLVSTVSDRLVDVGLNRPGRTDTFGVVADSHDLVLNIAGSQDTNENLTRRILLLFESVAITSPLVRKRVIGNIVDRYVMYDVVAPRPEPPRRIIPHFLLNDVVRYWRTMASDYAAKMWERQNEGWGLRNIKLRFSRKLIFIAGLLTCFSFELDPPPDAAAIRQDQANQSVRLATFVRSRLDQPPLELLSSILLRIELDEVARKLLGSYDSFLGILLDPEKRKELKELKITDALQSDVWQEARRASHDFRDAVEALFLAEGTLLKELTLRYGVF
jgi:predicted nucleotidyltransferase